MEISKIDVDEENPIFIGGSKRGGTTLLRRIVNAHSRVTIPPPGWFYHFLYSHLYSYGDLTQEGNILELVRDCLNIPVVKRYWNLGETPEEILLLVPERSFRGVLVALFRVYAERFNAAIWGSKTPSNVFWLREIQEDFPKARYVFIYRDGRDVSIDQVEIHWGPTNLYTASLLWQSYVQAIFHGKKLLPPGSYHEIYYEDLVREPESVVKGMCEFLELEYEPGMLEYYQQSADSFLEQSYHQKANEPITSDYVGLYKGFPRGDRRLQVAVMGDTLKELGYEVEDSPREIGFWERERYLEEDRHGGLLLEGGVEYKHLLRGKRLERKEKGIWSTNDRLLFQQK